MKRLLLFFTLSLSAILIQAQTVAPPLNMTLHSQWDADTLPTAGSREYNDIWGWVDCSGNEYAIIGSAAYVHFFDVTDPDNIRELDFFEGGQVGTWRDIKTYKERAYAVSENNMEGLMIFDLSNIQDTIIKTYQSSEFFSRSHNIFVDNDHGRLYCVGTDSMSNGIIILDIETDPDNPILLGSVPLQGGGYIHDIYVKDHIGYASHGYEGFYIWDFTDPENPSYIIDIPSTGYNHSSWTTADGNYAVFAEEVPLGQPLGIYDISDIYNGNIEVVNTFTFPLLAPEHTNNVPHNPYIRGNYVIVSHYHDGIQIFDISDVENPKQVAYYDSHANDFYSGYSGCWGVYPFLPSGTIIASDINEGLLVLTADSIDFDAVEVTLFPDATLNSASPYCEGDDIALELAAGAETYAWYKDGALLPDDQNLLATTEEGAYHATIANDYCIINTDTIDLEIFDYPDLSAFDASPISFCEGETATIFAPTGLDNYVWVNDSDTLQIGNNLFTTLSPGSYTLISYNGPCSSFSDSVVITENLLPDATVFFGDPSVAIDSVSALICEGHSTTLAVQLEDNANIQWFENDVPIGDNTNTLEVSNEGVYTAIVTSEGECIDESLEISITVSNVSSEIIFENGILSETVVGTSYQWYLDDNLIVDATSTDFTPLEDGSYYCEVTNADACTAISNTIDIVINGVRDIKSITSFSIAPNPTSDDIVLHLELSEATDLEVKLIHANGQLLKSFSQTASGLSAIPISMSDLPAGIYVIKLESNDGQMIRRVVKL